MTGPTLLIVDDDPRTCETLSDIFQEKGYTVATATTGREAQDKAKQTAFNIALIDIRLPDVDGTALLTEFRKTHPDMVCMIITGYASVQNAINALEEGAEGYFVKPIIIEEIVHRVEGVMDKQRLVRERRQAEEALRESESKHMRLHSMLRLMCDTLPELIWTKDLDGKFMFANKACCDDLLNARDTEEPVGKTDMYFADREAQSHPENPNYHTFGKTCTASDEAVLESRKAIRTEESGNIKGRFVVIDVLKAPFRDEEGKLIGTVGSAKDVTREMGVEKERERAEERIEHLNNVLGAIRNVNQVIVTEKDRDSLLRKSCDALVKARGYDAAWVGLLMDRQERSIDATAHKGRALQDGENFVTVKGSGFREDISRFCEDVMSGDHPPCVRNTLAQNVMFRVVDRSKECRDCPFNSGCTGREVAVVRLEHVGRFFGLLVISLVMRCWQPQDRASTPSALAGLTADEEEEDLLKGIASDIALGLHDIGVEDAHRAVEAKFRDLVESVPIGISVSNAEGIVVDANPTALKIFGYDSKEEFLKVPASVHYYDQKDRERFIKLFEQGSVRNFEARFKRKDGTVLWLSTTSVIRIADAGGTQFVNTFQDITERKLAEEALHQSEIRFRTLVEQLPTITYTAALDETSTTLYISPQIEKILGIPQEEYKTDPDFWLKHLHEEDRERVLKEVNNAHETGMPLISEYRMIATDGRIVWLRDEAAIIKDKGGNPLYLQGVMLDITERKLAEEALLESEEHYQRMVANVPGMVYQFVLHPDDSMAFPFVLNFGESK